LPKTANSANLRNSSLRNESRLRLWPHFFPGRFSGCRLAIVPSPYEVAVSTRSARWTETPLPGVSPTDKDFRWPAARDRAAQAGLAVRDGGVDTKGRGFEAPAARSGMSPLRSIARPHGQTPRHGRRHVPNEYLGSPVIGPAHAARPTRRGRARKSNVRASVMEDQVDLNF